MVTCLGRITLAMLAVHCYRLVMTRNELTGALNEMGWQGAGPHWDGWDLDQLQEVYDYTTRVERMKIDAEDR